MGYEFRCPIHGFIRVDEWERDIIGHSAFQRLRRIRQLGWTDYIYPGAMHNRFEHSLGVMHTATRLFDAILLSSTDILKDAFAYDDVGFGRHRKIVRIAALLHDLGHGPFSHAAEELLPQRADGRRYKHESYSAAIIRGPMRDVIDNHRVNQNYGIRADEVAALIEGSTNAEALLFWRELIDSQMDADRMDYLLRDSYHLGVRYGHYDLDRIVNTVCAVPGPEGRAPRIGVAEGGWHAAESLVLARYYMFTQVYFHNTRVAYDHHIAEVLRDLLPRGKFPPPTERGLSAYLGWDDWKVLGLLAAKRGGDHGRRLAERDHYRMFYQTTEHPTIEESQELDRVRERLRELIRHEATSSKSWYKLDETGVPVAMERGGRKMLSELSLPVANIGGHDQTLLFVKRDDVTRALSVMNGQPQ